jgi:hypothetical protein
MFDERYKYEWCIVSPGIKNGLNIAEINEFSGERMIWRYSMREVISNEDGIVWEVPGSSLRRYAKRFKLIFDEKDYR